MNLAPVAALGNPDRLKIHPLFRRWLFTWLLSNAHMHDAADMMPLRMRRSSLCSGPDWHVGKCGTIFAHCSSVSQT